MGDESGFGDETMSVDDQHGGSDALSAKDADDGLTSGRPGLLWCRDDSGNWESWLVWLVAGAAILGVIGCGVALFFVMTTRAEPKPTPTPPRVMALTTPGATPTRTHAVTPSATSVPTPTPTATATHTPAPTPTPTLTPTPTPDVILLGVKALGELNTVVYNLKTVVEKDVQQKGPLLLRPGLHFLLVAEGRVKAGVDFAEFVRYDIVGDRVTVYLPAPRITEYSVDPNSLETYYIHTGFGLDEKFAIEKHNEAVVEAQESLRRAALESDILEAASTNAAGLVQSLVLGLGFSKVDVRFVPRGDETDVLEGPFELILTPAPFATATPEG